MSFPVITIDGPSGAGKGTVCLKLAQALDYRLLDSGALYRIVGLKAFEAKLLTNTELDSKDEENIAELTNKLHIQFLPRETGEVDIVVDGSNVAGEIRNETVGGYASKVAALPKVRAALLALQKNMANDSGLIADGRDMGTVVFPNADAKVYLTASAEARANRRVAQLEQAGQSADYQAILQSIQQRDERDENRSVSPSKPAEDALVLDSSQMNAEDVYSKIKEFCQTKGICFSD
ncbi:(d)CMP kinase [Psychrobacter sanguinis]|uniref:(d)CMP kinase n=1 Tax=Psychrobacter sanguinis TaxID=861445 RepID=UPI00020C7EAB|nr:(d)CMP kinase [Psychrobacter sanguinis]EGK10947.1 cytidylate kinase [Psychrobacter sp. 1501(2011)]MCC3307386.1 (d)CMP kinase [Psychrobacter sanguinis]MCD9152667.1 (d)CMP kinase [Psychrobacter sanguinis]MDY3305258.1 (d)CMP kinase [Psychrobacter sanguinis]UEC24721.1 (d)CMP kinase [Psychrobacter sanguinis]